MKILQRIAPKTVDEIDNFKSSGKTAQLKSGVTSQVAADKKAAQSPIETTAKEAPAPGPTRTETPQPPTEPGPPPPDIGGAQAAPKPLSDSEISLDEGTKEVDQLWKDNKLTEERLAKSTEPSAQEAIDTKRGAAENAIKAPQAYRQQEQGILSQAKGDANATAVAGTGGMYSTRTEKFTGISGNQDTARTTDETSRIEFADKVKKIYTDTQTQVETQLDKLDTDVTTQFDTGADTARKNFDESVRRKKNDYFDDHPFARLKAWLGLPNNLKALYDAAMNEYIAEMTLVIDRVATTVDTGLTSVRDKIKTARSDVQKVVDDFKSKGKQIDETALAEVEGNFTSLETTVKEREKQITSALEANFNKRIDELEKHRQAMEEADRGWVGRAIDKAKSVIELYKKIRALLARFASIIEQILDDPGGFLGNLITGIKAGLSQFIGNIATHLKAGLMAWLTGAVAQAGVQLPTSFDLKGIISLVLTILGVTYANFRSRAVRIVGEPIVKGLETTAEIFITLATQGVAGVVRFIQDRLSDLKSMFMEGIIGWVREKIVIAGITWIIGLLNPAAGLLKIGNAIIKIVDFFMTRGAQIAGLVSAIVDSLAAIASGAVGAMAGAIESALARAIPVTLGFLASLLGLPDIANAVRELIQKARAKVDAAMDWLIGKAVKLAKKAGSFLKGLVGGKKKEKKPEEKPPPETNDPEHDAKVEAGLAAIDTQEQQYLEDGLITEANAQKVASSVKGSHTVFKSITVVDGGDTWDYSYTASPKGKKTGERGVKKKMPVASVEFFRKPNLQHMKAEYERQLKGQQSGINAMTVSNWLKNRNAFVGRLEAAKAAGKSKPSGRDPTSGTHQKNAKKEAIEVIWKRLQEGKPVERLPASVKTRGQVERWVNKQAALHEPDQVAGGGTEIKVKSSKNVADVLGSSAVNSHIGAQWQSRVGKVQSKTKGVSIDF